jgi:uncharacterized protein YdeI (YjbR/CyaY-like superfamily)
MAELPVLPFPTSRAWAAWLARNHATAAGVWIKFAKKASGIRSIYYPEALEIALCFGWIDGQSKRVDDAWFVQRFTPRGSRSLWSKINCDKATALIAAGKMKPAGLAEVERARKDGRWAQAYDSPSRASVPDDLAAAMAGNARLLVYLRQNGYPGWDQFAYWDAADQLYKIDWPNVAVAGHSGFAALLANQRDVYRVIMLAEVADSWGNPRRPAPWLTDHPTPSSHLPPAPRRGAPRRAPHPQVRPPARRIRPVPRPADDRRGAPHERALGGNTTTLFLGTP